VTVALASGAGGAAVYGLADGGSNAAPAAVVTAAPTARPASAVKTNGSLSVNQIYQRTNPGVVDIKVTTGASAPTDNFGGPGGGGNGSGQASQAEGSGFVIDGDGHIATNQHVVDGANKITVTFADGTKAGAKVVGTDSSTDVAVIKVDAPKSELHPLQFADSNGVLVGDGVVAIGSPFGLEGTVTTGIVSALNRPVTTQAEEQQPQQPTDPFGQGQQGNQGQGSDSSQVVTNAIQTSAAINPGNSGGALVNAAGQLIGINSSIATLGSSGSSQSGSIGIGFAIPVNEAKSIAQQLISKGSAQHAFLGVSLQDAMASDGTSQRAGAQVAAVTSGTPAAAAGLKKGDVIVAVNGERVDSTLSLVGNIRERSVGDKVALTVLRDGKELKLTATLVAKANTTQ
jgi:putative serine protease PepD